MSAFTVGLKQSERKDAVGEADQLVVLGDGFHLEDAPVKFGETARLFRIDRQAAELRHKNLLLLPGTLVERPVRCNSRPSIQRCLDSAVGHTICLVSSSVGGAIWPRRQK